MPEVIAHNNSVLGNLNILSETPIVSAQELRGALPIDDKSRQTVFQGRRELEQILDGKDRRLFVVVGPCSIHDVDAALEYANRLKRLSEAVKDRILIIMRVYFVKPRTTIGWKGLINDPFLDDSFDIEQGLYLARKLLLDIARLGLPTGTEVLEAMTPQYLDDLISWSAIGARTTESQMHREIASGLSTPVGFKNGTDGSVSVAINALKSVAQSHRFLGVSYEGKSSVFHTRGNRYGHVVLRGGTQPNYDKLSIESVAEELSKAGLRREVMVDCSHGNSAKDHNRQPAVFDNCLRQLEEGSSRIIGLMLESNLLPGRQDLDANPSKLEYGVSVTDACIGWDTTSEVLLDAHKRLLTLW